MNIAIVSYWSCPLTRLGVLNAGGMSVYLLGLANELGKIGHSVDIYTRCHKENDEGIIWVNKNIRIIHLKINNKLDHYKGAVIFGGVISQYIKRTRLNYHLFHAHYFFSGVTCLALSKKINLPVVITFHTLAAMKDLYGGIKDEKRRQTEIEIAQKVNGIISSTELEKDELVKLYKVPAKKISVVSPGVNFNLFKRRDKAKSRNMLNLDYHKDIILFVGRIDPIKGIEFLIEAVAYLVNKIPEFEDNFRVLLIGGDVKSKNFWQHPEVKKIKNLIIEKKLECCVKFLGSRPHNILPFYYSAADVVVAPSVYESFGLVILEAMASGACVLVSCVGGLKYLVDDKINGRLFESGNFVSLADILWQLLSDASQRQKLGRKAIDKARRFSWNKQAGKIVEVYKKYI